MSLEQISASTKIGTRLLQALEEDKFNQLPGGIFNKGFVRAYSHCLGLDEDQTVAEYLEASGDAAPPRTEIPIREDEARENEEHVRRLEASGNGSLHRIPWGWFAALLLVIAIALSLWNRRQREHARYLPPSAPSTAGGQLPASQASGGLSGTTSGAVSGTPSGTTSGTTADGSSPALAGPAASQLTASGASAGALGTASSATPASSNGAVAAIPGEFTVVVHTRDECWIEITADGKALPSELLPAGSERSIRGQKEVVVKAGNAGGVDFRFNGKKVEMGAQYGQVKTVAFGPAGMLPAPPPSTP